MSSYSRKVGIIKRFVRDKRVGVALSGGVDSSVLLHIVSQSARGVLAFIIRSELLDPVEVDGAVKVAGEIGVGYRILPVNLLGIDCIRLNRRDRCYLCKKNSFRRILEIAREEGISSIFDGSNYDDLSKDRPGLKALAELGVRSPLAEVGFRKNEIREYARDVGLSVADKPSDSCLATRIPFNEELTEEKLRLVMSCERALKDNFGFRDVRVRLSAVRGAVVELCSSGVERLRGNYVLRDRVIGVLGGFGVKKVRFRVR